jgi:signal transduction histidine kinase
MNSRAASSSATAPEARFRRQVIVPVAAALAILVASFVLATAYYLEWIEAQETAQSARHAYQLRDHLLGRESLLLGFLTRRFADSYRGEAAAMRGRDARRLEAVGREAFAELRRDFDITHGYFITPDRRVVLRLHRPDLAGDEVQRETLAYAEHSGQPATGVEVGRTAVPTLRHVLPWHEGGKLIGYIELGKEVDSLMREIRDMLGVDTVAVIHKEFSNREDYAMGKATLGFRGNWDDYEHLAVLESSLSRIPPELINEWQKGTTDVFQIADDGRIWSTSLLPLEDIGGRQSISLALMRDVTERHLDQRRNFTLGIAVAALLAALLLLVLYWRTGRIEDHVVGAYERIRNSEQALRVASEKALAANIAKSQFLSVVSHELRTPLNGILGMAQLLEMDDISAAERREFLANIRASGENLLALINDILDLSRIETGEIKLVVTPFDPAALVDASARRYLARAQAKGLALEANWTGSGGVILLGDPARLSQMLGNYLDNAVKFSMHGTIRVESMVVAEGGEPGGVLLEFAVADEGIGIAEEARAGLFQAFSQVDASATRRHGGCGVGLSIVKGLAEAMHGEVGFDSRPGAGSRFWFRVRCGVPSADAMQSA